MIRILFVEDDAVLMANMRRSLSIMRREWDMKFFATAEDAFISMSEHSFDVIVTDYDLPGMNGGELLAMVQYQYPRAVRVLMADSNYSISGAATAHRILPKPCDPAMLSCAIERAFELEQRLSDPDLQSMISEVGALPMPPQHVVALNDLLAADDSTVDQIADVIANNPGMTAKVMQVVNSAYFALNAPITDVREAVAYLGRDAVRNLCVAMELMKTFEEAPAIVQSIVDEINERSLAVACLAREISPNRSTGNQAYVAGLLHDVGLLLMASQLPERFLELRVQTMRCNLTLTEVEMEIFGAHHADVGAHLLDLWGLPLEIVEAVARHHDASDVPTNEFDALHAVHIADSMVSSQEEGDDAWEPDGHLDKDYLESMGVRTEDVERLLARQA